MYVLVILLAEVLRRVVDSHTQFSLMRITLLQTWMPSSVTRFSQSEVFPQMIMVTWPGCTLLAHRLNDINSLIYRRTILIIIIMATKQQSSVFTGIYWYKVLLVKCKGYSRLYHPDISCNILEMTHQVCSPTLSVTFINNLERFILQMCITSNTGASQ